MNHVAKIAVPLLSLGLALLGCSQTEKPVVDETPVAAAAAQSASPEAPGAKRSANEPDVADVQQANPTAVSYTPPFPERVELFQPPQRALNAARREDEHGETVELKGFIHVDEPRAVLSIDGVISSVPEGGEKYGVQVIAIKPPTVVLQRGGRSPWTATLE
jgi:hypothetical protein